MPILVGSGLSKISISLLLLRLLGDAAGRMRKYFLHGINIFVIMYTLIDIISDVAACKPLAKVWDLELPGKCRSPHSVVSVVYFQGVLSSTSQSLPHAFLPYDPYSDTLTATGQEVPDTPRRKASTSMVITPRHMATPSARILEHRV
ncbi:MAG: hypothetical protein Q9172_004678 [Xanthocarpia lactea]